MAIVNVVYASNNFVIIYIDHVETIDLDDLAAYAPVELPPVILCPHKVQQQQNGASAANF
jgi:hypothetical protein